MLQNIYKHATAKVLGLLTTMADKEQPVKPQRIKALDPSVVNRIAAGEIIVTPSNALKEMLENSIDAGSTAIDIIVKGGGLKLLQISDNGHGINKEDLPILCERFTTSKLSSFEDLNSIATYGFRGEALASISHIAHLTITTRSQESDCAWRANYHDGKLVASRAGSSEEPKPVAGRQGTQILVEDLFFNVPSRLRAFRSPSDEYNRIIDVVGRYAVHCAGVAFACKKHGESQNSLFTAASASTVDRIRSVYSSAIANELIEVNVPEDKRFGLLGVNGLITNANYNTKKSYQPLFFINHRSVSCDPLKRALSHLYSSFLPKGSHSFIYMSLLIAPDKLDVNIHPTKREVRFLFEDEIIQRICQVVQKSLQEVDSSRVFKTQSVLQGLIPIDSASSYVAGQKRVQEYNLVRTDAKARKLTNMLSDKQSTKRHSDLSKASDASSPSNAEHGQVESAETVLDYAYDTVERERMNIRLNSVKQLRKGEVAKLHNGLTEIFANHTFVGIVDENRRFAAIQHDVKLFLVDYGALSYRLFYQIGLSDFGNFGTIKLSAGLDVKRLINLCVTEDENAKTEFDSSMVEKMLDMRAMLLEYFSIDITEKGEIHSIPLLLRNYFPNLGKLPKFLYRMSQYVNWEEEKACFESILNELAMFYVPEPIPPESVNEDHSTETTLSLRRQQLTNEIEHTVFPAIKRRLIATTDLLRSVIEIANLPGLYKVSPQMSTSALFNRDSNTACGTESDVAQSTSEANPQDTHLTSIVNLEDSDMIIANERTNQ